MSGPPVAQALLDALGVESTDSATPPSFPDLLQKLYAMKFQGMVTLHFAGGVPRSVVLTQPVTLPLDTGKPPGA